MAELDAKLRIGNDLYSLPMHIVNDIKRMVSPYQGAAVDIAEPTEEGFNQLQKAYEDRGVTIDQMGDKITELLNERTELLAYKRELDELKAGGKDHVPPEAPPASEDLTDNADAGAIPPSAHGPAPLPGVPDESESTHGTDAGGD